MTTELDLFRDYRYRVKTERPAKTPADVCQSRHGGNQHSANANKRVSKAADREAVYSLIKQAADGRTLKELCAIMGKTPNALSGRITELKMIGRVEVNGTREGCGVNFATLNERNK
jgi:hypothetical protein